MSACQIGRGVRQGCSLSPLLFIIYDKAMVREARENDEHRIKVGQEVTSMIRYADDKAVIPSSKKNLQKLMDSISKVMQDYSMKIKC